LILAPVDCLSKNAAAQSAFRSRLADMLCCLARTVRSIFLEKQETAVAPELLVTAFVKPNCRERQDSHWWLWWLNVLRKRAVSLLVLAVGVLLDARRSCCLIVVSDVCSPYTKLQIVVLIPCAARSGHWTPVLCSHQKWEPNTRILLWATTNRRTLVRNFDFFLVFRSKGLRLGIGPNDISKKM